MLSCEEATELCSEEMERPLRLRERMALGAHLWMCKGCPNYRDQMKALRDAARAYAAGQAITTEPGDAQPPPGGGGV